MAGKKKGVKHTVRSKDSQHVVQSRVPEKDISLLKLFKYIALFFVPVIVFCLSSWPCWDWHWAA